MLAQEEYARCVAAAMRADRAAGTGQMNLSKGRQGLDLLHTGADNSIFHTSVRDKNLIQVNIGGISDAVFNVLQEHSLKLAAIFFPDAHFPVLDDDAGLEIHQVRAKHGHRGAAAALCRNSSESMTKDAST